MLKRESIKEGALLFYPLVGLMEKVVIFSITGESVIVSSVSGSLMEVEMQDIMEFGMTKLSFYTMLGLVVFLPIIASFLLFYAVINGGI